MTTGSPHAHGAGSSPGVPAELLFLVRPTAPDELATPETVSREEIELKQGIRAFVKSEVVPHSRALEAKDRATLLRLLARAADVGLTGITIPTRFGGVGASVTGVMLAASELAAQESFAASIGAHLGIGSLPLVLFGSDALRARYLPELARGQRIGAYALTEPTAGSDALSCKTTAEKVDGQSFRLSGSKQFITNAGIAGLYTVFAKVGGSAFTAFVIPAETTGISIGRPEEKLGLHGSVTASVTLDGATVSGDHILGEIGHGHRVAFGVLNLGRLKLGFTSMGSAREALAMALLYARDRRQFGRSIGEFGLIRDKLAQMAARVFWVEGMAVRIARSFDAALGGGLGETGQDTVGHALKRLAVLSALLKVYASEQVAYVVDEALQVHGGYGFIEEYPICRMYRDVRINRIFEGTNEINRLVAGGAIVKAAREGGLLEKPATATSSVDLAHALRMGLYACLTATLERFGTRVDEEQCVLAGIADLAMELLALDTAIARVAAASAHSNRALFEALLAVGMEGARRRVIGTIVPLATRLGMQGNLHGLVERMVEGATDVTDATHYVSTTLLDRGDLE